MEIHLDPISCAASAFSCEVELTGTQMRPLVVFSRLHISIIADATNFDSCQRAATEIYRLLADEDDSLAFCEHAVDQLAMYAVEHIDQLPRRTWLAST
jgi:hypothetical protein